MESLFRENVDIAFILQCSEHGVHVMEKTIKYASKLCMKIHIREMNKSIKKGIINLKEIQNKINSIIYMKSM